MVINKKSFSVILVLFLFVILFAPNVFALGQPCTVISKSWTNDFYGTPFNPISTSSYLNMVDAVVTVSGNCDLTRMYITLYGMGNNNFDIINTQLARYIINDDGSFTLFIPTPSNLYYYSQSSGANIIPSSLTFNLGTSVTGSPDGFITPQSTFNPVLQLSTIVENVASVTCQAGTSCSNDRTSCVNGTTILQRCSSSNYCRAYIVHPSNGGSSVGGCLPKLEDGQECSDNFQCLSGSCLSNGVTIVCSPISSSNPIHPITPTPISCITDIDCPYYNTLCSNGQCQNAGFCTTGPFSALNCPSGYECANSKCERRSSLIQDCDELTSPQVKDDFEFFSENDIYSIGLDNYVYHWETNAWNTVTLTGALNKDLRVTENPLTVYSIGIDNLLYKIEPQTPQTPWMLAIQGDNQQITSFDINNVIYAIGTDKKLYNSVSTSSRQPFGLLSDGLLLIGKIHYYNGILYGISASDKRIYKFINNDWVAWSPGSIKDDFYIVSDSLVFAIGDDGNLYSWDGHSVSWNLINPGQSGDAKYKIHYSNAYLYTIGGSDGRIYKCPIPCSSNSNCQSGQTCTNNICVQPTPVGSCITNSDCTSGLICTNGNCLPQPQQPTPCTVNTDCSGNQICDTTSHNCVTPTDPCVNTNCQNNQYCNPGDSTHAATCINGHASDGTNCTRQENCGLGSICQPQTGTCQTCVSDVDTDGDGEKDCSDYCPLDRSKKTAGDRPCSSVPSTLTCDDVNGAVCNPPGNCGTGSSYSQITREANCCIGANPTCEVTEVDASGSVTTVTRSACNADASGQGTRTIIRTTTNGRSETTTEVCTSLRTITNNGGTQKASFFGVISLALSMLGIGLYYSFRNVNKKNNRKN